MAFDDTREFLYWFLGIATKGTKVFGEGVLTEAILRKHLLGGPAGWYVIPVSAVSASATIIQGIASLRKYEASKTARKTLDRLFKFERFLDVHGTVASTLFVLFSTSLPINELIAIIGTEIITIPFASWRAYKCTVDKEYWVTKLEPVSYNITMTSTKSTGIELQDFPIEQESDSRFSVHGLKEFMLKHCPTQAGDTESEDQPDIHDYIEEYICDCMRKDSKKFWQVLRNSIAYGSEIACNVGFLEIVLEGFFTFNIGLYSLIPSTVVFIIAFSLGYSMERINSLLLEMSNSNLLTDPALRQDVHNLLVEFYRKSAANIKLFAQLAEFLKNFLITFIGFMFMVTAPSINDANGKSYVPDWWAIIGATLSVFFGWWSVLSVNRAQQQMAKRTGTEPLLKDGEVNASASSVPDRLLAARRAGEAMHEQPKGCCDGLGDYLYSFFRSHREGTISSEALQGLRRPLVTSTHERENRTRTRSQQLAINALP